MGIEQILTDLTAAVKEQNDLLKRALANASGGNRATEQAKPTEAPAAEQPKRGPGRPRGSTTTKTMTLEEFRDKFSSWLAAAGNEGEKEARKDHIKSMVDFFGVGSMREIPTDKWPEALGYLDQIKKGETPNFMNEDEPAQDESLI